MTVDLGAYFYWCGGDGNSGGQDPGSSEAFSALATHSNGSVYTAEDLNNRCQQFDARLGFVRVTASNMNDNLDVTCSAYDGNVYVCNRTTNVNIRQADGTLVRQWNGPVGHKIVDLNSITLDGVGNVYIGDNSQPEMRIYDTLGNYVSTPSWGAGVWGQKTQAFSYDGTLGYLGSSVFRTSDGVQVATLTDETGTPISGVLTTYIPPGGPNNNVWTYCGPTGDLYRHTQAGVLVGHFRILLTLQTPVGNRLIDGTAAYAIPSTSEQWVYVTSYPFPYIMAFYIGGSGNRAPMLPRGRGASW